MTSTFRVVSGIQISILREVEIAVKKTEKKNSFCN